MAHGAWWFPASVLGDGQMKAISLRPDIATSYLAGVICGDGFCTKNGFGLHVKDRDFLEAFRSAIEIVFGFKPNAINEGPYCRARIGNRTGRFDYLKSYKPKTTKQMAAWVKGMFDSEGSAILTKLKIGINCFSRRICMCSSDRGLLKTTQYYLSIIKELEGKLESFIR